MELHCTFCRFAHQFSFCDEVGSFPNWYLVHHLANLRKTCLKMFRVELYCIFSAKIIQINGSTIVLHVLVNWNPYQYLSSNLKSLFVWAICDTKSFVLEKAFKFFCIRCINLFILYMKMFNEKVISHRKRPMNSLMQLNDEQ